MPNTTYLNLPYPGLTNAPNVPADLQALAQAVDALVGPWPTYNPTFAGTSFSLGNGSASGKFLQLGKRVDFIATLTVGSTTTIGTGLTVSLPGNHQNTGLKVNVGGQIFDTSANKNYAMFVEVITSGCFLRYLNGGAGGELASVSSTGPITFANGDIITVTGTYERV